MEGMKDTRTGLRRAGAACVEGGESSGGERRGKEGGGEEKGQSVFRREQAAGSAAPASPESGT